MQIEQVREAMMEARRFILTAAPALDRAYEEGNKAAIPVIKERLRHTQESAALRRASMDLTMALSRMRRS